MYKDWQNHGKTSMLRIFSDSAPAVGSGMFQAANFVLGRLSHLAVLALVYVV